MALGLPVDELVVVIDAGAVVSQSKAIAGVSGRSVIGMTQREVESRIPRVAIHERNASEELKVFDSVIACLDEITPWVTMSSPGVAYFESDSPVKFYGSEAALCEKTAGLVSQALKELNPNYKECFGLGVSQGYFASWLAAQTQQESQFNIIAESETREFISDWPIGYLALGENADLISKLVKLGIETIGDWVKLPASSVSGRFGLVGVRAHQLACGFQDYVNQIDVSDKDYSYEWVFQVPTSDSQQCGHAAAALAEELISDLKASGTSCVRLSVIAETESAETFQRYWRYGGLKITPQDVAKRVGWQIDSWISSSSGPRSPVVRLQIQADQLMPATGKQLSLFDNQSQTQVNAVRRLVTRLSALVGENNVAVASIKGGFALKDRAEFVPAVNVDFELEDLGIEPDPDLDAPWPGSMPKPSPTKVFTELKQVKLVDGNSQLVGVSARGELTAKPKHMLGFSSSTSFEVESWAGPWLESRQWWKQDFVRSARMQVVVCDRSSDRRGYLLVLQQGNWFIEASYS